tara:strand:+ start:3064 stop:3900 length:837 start_codon:yes stop_codon:yes gene_type:complete
MWIQKPSDMFLVRTSAMNEFDRDVAPSGELLRFQKALRKKMRDVQFSRDMHRSCHVYYPHEPFVRGKLRETGNWYVQSRTIENQRYRPDNIEHYRHGSGNLATAVKKAAAALTPWSVREMASIHSKAYDQGRDLQIGEVESKVKEGAAYLGLSSKSRALIALKNMVHQIADLDVKSKVLDVTRYMQETEDLRGIGSQPTFVYIGQIPNGTQFMDTLHIDSIGYNFIQTDALQARHWENSTDDKYSDLVGKVSVLNMAPVGDYVSGVGMKVDEDMFYVC